MSYKSTDRFLSFVLAFMLIFAGIPAFADDGVPLGTSTPAPGVAGGIGQFNMLAEYPVATTVTFNGQPVAGANVELCMVDSDGLGHFYGDISTTDSSGYVSFGDRSSLATDQYFFYVYKGDGLAEYDGREKTRLFPFPAKSLG